jgi:zinc transport system substrate-binding protein
MKRVTVLILLLVAASAASAWLAARRQPAKAPERGRVVVAATFYPLAEAVRRVGGERVDVLTLVPAGSEPHEYEPTPRDIAATDGARVLVMNGSIDGWADRFAPVFSAPGRAFVRVADRLPEVEKDPHVWLDPVRAQATVEAIRDALLAADPAGEAWYRAGADRYLEDLRGLDAAYAEGLRSCSRRKVVSSHDAFGYVAERYGFEAVPIAGLSPEEEPSPKRMAEIAAEAKAAGVTRIFFETLVSPKLAETIAREIGAKTAVFDPIEGLSDEDAAAGGSYLTVMRRNLEALREAMVCW